MNYIDDRVIQSANLILDGNKTVREVARIIGYSKSTVHNDLTDRLKELNNSLYLEVKKILEYNKKIRHIRGGEATKLKYLHKPQ